MKTIQEVLRLSTEFLEKKKVEIPKLSSEELLAACLQCKRLDLYLQFDRPLDEKELASYRELLKRRAEGEPIAHILGQVAFYGLQLKVNPHVLIPRHETEILLSEIVQEYKKEVGTKRVFDVCCGSGCLGLGLKKAFPEFQVTLGDLSSDALKVAKGNAQLNHLTVDFVEGDLLVPFQGKADIIVCNPPYVSEQEYLGLSREVKAFEPKMALMAGKTGVEFYQRLSHMLPNYLQPDGKIFLEIGKGQAEMVTNLFNSPFWKELQVKKDWAGHDRFFSVRYFP